jgi:hypothetical protein
MLYKGESEVKILLLRINKDIENIWLEKLEKDIIENLNSVDFDLVYNDKTHEINLLEFDIINDNNNQNYNNSNSTIKYNKILKLVYKVQPIQKFKKEI